MARNSRKKALGKYEGQQYRGGREKGLKSLKKLDGGKVENQYGVQFTADEKKALERAVNTANAKRKRQLDSLGKLPRIVNGKPTGQTMSDLGEYGKVSDLIITRKTKSLQRFRNRGEFESYMRYLGKVNSRDYLPAKVQIYKDNMAKAIEKQLPGMADDVIDAIRKMKPNDFIKFAYTHDDISIGHIYGPDAQTAKANTLRSALGLEPVSDATTPEIPSEWEDELEE